MFSPERGGVVSGERAFDYADEVNRIYAGGQGQGTLRQIVQVDDTTREGVSGLNLREDFKDARMTSTTAGLTAEANTFLRAGRPLRTFNVKLDPYAPGCVYGVNWKWGDAISVVFEGETFDAMVDSVSVDVQDKGETITPTLRTIDT